ncbi:MAG: DNA mismatch repair endonuclease MutL [Bacteroidia bacterium]|nr:DNA mismatch repair endonuclease MutL [Bacteroidia bacterium]
MTTDALEQRIQILPESVINQIAAGEVVLRPASVIKELGENAIDAEANMITFWTEEGGKALIKVTDTGIGMSPLDAELCFERHATSKIREAKDLYRLGTKGFRGEALASIAAVAEVELFTRRPQDAIGTHVVISFGMKRLGEPVRCASGTTLIVRKLFQHIPVRRKSLRSDLTEHRHNLQEFFRLAYPHPERHFRFYHNQALIYDLPPTGLAERILALHPSLSTAALVPVEEETSLFVVRGYIVLPEETPPQNRENFLFINRRYIRHPSIQQALYQLYRPLIPTETRPLYWLFLEVPPDQVDINVTPSKTEARLLHELEIRAMLTSIVRRVLAVSNLSIPTDWFHRPSITLPPKPSAVELSSPLTPPQQERLSLAPPPSPRGEFLLLYGRFLIIAKREDAWFIDVLGAHERILYERYLQGIPVASQGLLFPALAPISSAQASLLAEMQPLLIERGLALEIREGREAVLHAIPAGLPPATAPLLLEELVRVAECDTLPADWRERLAKHIARYGALRPPYTLTAEAVETLWGDLSQCEDPNHSPSGRRIRFRLNEETLEKLFQV